MDLDQKDYLIKDSVESDALKWFIQKVGKDKWVNRRNKIHSNLKMLLCKGNTNTKSASLSPEHINDKITYYLYLLEVELKYGYCFNKFHVSRIFRIFTSIGINIKFLDSIIGIDKKVNDIFHRYKNDPFPHLFELIVAIQYHREGWNTTLLYPSGHKKSNDISIANKSSIYNIECKYLSRDLKFVKDEESLFDDLTTYLKEKINIKNQFYSFDLDFHIPIHEISKFDLLSLFNSILMNGVDSGYNSNEQLSIQFNSQKTNIIKNHFDRFKVLFPSPVLIKLFFIDFCPYTKYAFIIDDSSLEKCFETNSQWISANPKYIFAFKYRFSSNLSKDKRIKAALSKVHDAEKQLPTDRPSFIHVGYETSEEIETEMNRLEKISDSLKDYTPKNKSIEAILINAFMCFSTESTYDSRETLIRFNLKKTKNKIFEKDLSHSFLFSCHDLINDRKTHWEIDKLFRET